RTDGAGPPVRVRVTGRKLPYTVRSTPALFFLPAYLRPRRVTICRTARAQKPSGILRSARSVRGASVAKAFSGHLHPGIVDMPPDGTLSSSRLDLRGLTVAAGDAVRLSPCLPWRLRWIRSRCLAGVRHPLTPFLGPSRFIARTGHAR